MTSITGDLAWPCKITASYPAYLSSAPKWPPERLNPYIPVSGDLKFTLTLDEPNAIVPVKGPVARMSLASSDRGSMVGETSLERRAAPRPLPPKYP
jgi:hypothetical protein